MQNSSTWYYISVGNSTWITAKHAIVHIDIDIAQLKSDIRMTKIVHKVGVNTTQIITEGQ